jgi:hypothetical protein
MSAEIPSGAGAVSALWIAVASGSAGGVEPVEPVAAIASAAVAPSAATIPPIKATSRVVDRVRRNLTVILSLRLSRRSSRESGEIHESRQLNR